MTSAKWLTADAMIAAVSASARPSIVARVCSMTAMIPRSAAISEPVHTGCRSSCASSIAVAQAVGVVPFAAASSRSRARTASRSRSVSLRALPMEAGAAGSSRTVASMPSRSMAAAVLPRERA